MAPQRCVDCHFFVKLYPPEHGNPAWKDSPNHEQRERCRGGDFSWTSTHYSLGCHMGVWDEGVYKEPDARYRITVETDRSGECFFYPWQPGMLMRAAETLQRRQEEHRQTRRELRLTRWGLYLAAAGLLINAAIDIAACFGWGP